MKTKLLLFLFLGMISQSAHSQSISDHFGGIKTNYEIYSDTVKLDVKSQMIIRNAGYTYEIGSDLSYSYGAGFESFHLEFSTTTDLEVFSKPKIRHSRYEVFFYDSAWNILASIEMHPGRFSIIRNTNQPGSLTFYSIDLFKIPISLFEAASKINILEIHPSK